MKLKTEKNIYTGRKMFNCQFIDYITLGKTIFEF